MQRLLAGNAFFGDQSFQRRQPMGIISLAGVGIAFALRQLDFLR
jgi:hypothetical protein